MIARCALLCLVLALPLFAEQQPVAPAKVSDFPPGMTAGDVRQKLGMPARVSRQILYHRHLEQWIYSAPIDLRLEFRCLPGQEARLQTVQSTARQAGP